MNSMNALVFHGPNDIRLEKMTIPEAGPGEAIVKVTSAQASGISTSCPRCVPADRPDCTG